MDGWVDGWMDVCMYVCVYVYVCMQRLTRCVHVLFVKQVAFLLKLSNFSSIFSDSRRKARAAFLQEISVG